MRRAVALFILLFMFPAAACAANQAVPSNWQNATPQGLADEGFEYLIEGDYGKMGQAWLDDMDEKVMGKDNLNSLQVQLVSTLSMLGKCSHYELLIREEYGTSFIKLVYAAFMEKTPLFMTFRYYRPDKVWHLAKIGVSDDWSSLDK